MINKTKILFYKNTYVIILLLKKIKISRAIFLNSSLNFFKFDLRNKYIL